MKKMKKIFALLIAMVMVLGMSTSVFAASIEVKDVIDGETYTAYKILNYTDNGKTGEERSASYYLSSTEYTQIGSVLEAAGFHFTASSDGTQYFVDNGDKLDAAKAAEYLGAHVSDLGDALGKKTATGADGKAEFTDLATGYYFVTSTAGSLCALHEDTDIATVVEKNTVTTPDKKQGTETGKYSNDQLDLMIGSTVYYDAEITIGKGANYQLVGKDTLDAGLTLDQDSITVKVGDTAVAETNYTIDPISAQGFTITFPATYVSTLNEGDVIKIEYTAKVNASAVIRGDNKNTFDLDYSKQHFDDNTVVKTYDAQVKKVDATTKEFLNGAGFKLYDASEGGNQITVAEDNTGYYVSADADEEIMITSADGANIRGLAPGTYYLEETTVPAGYNKLAAREPVVVTKDATAAVQISVENNAGSVLPSTGGIGTTIFYVIGAILVIGAGVVLVTRRRMNVQ